MSASSLNFSSNIFHQPTFDHYRYAKKNAIASVIVKVALAYFAIPYLAQLLGFSSHKIIPIICPEWISWTTFFVGFFVTPLVGLILNSLYYFKENNELTLSQKICIWIYFPTQKDQEGYACPLQIHEAYQTKNLVRSFIRGVFWYVPVIRAVTPILFQVLIYSSKGCEKKLKWVVVKKPFLMTYLIDKLAKEFWVIPQLRMPVMQSIVNGKLDETCIDFLQSLEESVIKRIDKSLASKYAHVKSFIAVICSLPEEIIKSLIIHLRCNFGENGLSIDREVVLQLILELCNCATLSFELLQQELKTGQVRSTGSQDEIQDDCLERILSKRGQSFEEYCNEFEEVCRKFIEVLAQCTDVPDNSLFSINSYIQPTANEKKKQLLDYFTLVSVEFFQKLRLFALSGKCDDSLDEKVKILNQTSINKLRAVAMHQEVLVKILVSILAKNLTHNAEFKKFTGSEDFNPYVVDNNEAADQLKEVVKRVVSVGFSFLCQMNFSSSELASTLNGKVYEEGISIECPKAIKHILNIYFKIHHHLDWFIYYLGTWFFNYLIPVALLNLVQDAVINEMIEPLSFENVLLQLHRSINHVLETIDQKVVPSSSVVRNTLIIRKQTLGLAERNEHVFQNILELKKLTNQTRRISGRAGNLHDNY